jgi:hypothetical protein
VPGFVERDLKAALDTGLRRHDGLSLAGRCAYAPAMTQHILVTGASRGIGASILEALSGQRVVGHSSRG